MTLSKFIKSSFKKKIKLLLRKKNYYFNRQFIPDILDSINIENTNICNLECKFCAYSKRDFEKIPHTSMKIDFFESVVKQCLELGYKNIGLTPLTGEIFMDQDIFKKFYFLDKLTNFEGYFFYSNFIPLTEDKIRNILALKKLKNFAISIYGHDEETFIKFSKGTINSYKKLIKNMNYLLNLLKSQNHSLNIEITQRSSQDYSLKENQSELSEIIKKILEFSNVRYSKSHNFNNWGGAIKEHDIADLNIKFEKNLVPKTGSCSLIYSRLLIGANGYVNACACRDVDFTLKLGDLKYEKLKDIISLKNNVYKNLIENQEKNFFPKVCVSCDFYKSIYEKKNYPTRILKNKMNKIYSLKEVKDQLNFR